MKKLLLIIFLSFLLNSTSYGEHASWSYDLAWFPKYEVKGSDQYYKFNSNLIEDKIIKKEIKNYKKTGLISYLLYEDGIIVIDEKSQEHWLTSDKISEEKRLLVSHSVVSVELGEDQKAISYYEKAIVIRSNHTNTHNNLGIVFMKLGEFNKAIGCYKKAIEIEPNHADTHNNLGLAHQQLGELQKAKVYYEQALVLDPNKEKFNANYGELLLSLNQHKKGLEYVNKGSGCIDFTQQNFKII